MSTDTTPDAVDHARAIRKIASHWATFFGPFIHNDNLWYTDTFMDGKDAGEIGSDMTEVKRHAAALDAARIAAEARAERLRDYAMTLENEVQLRVASYIVVDFSGAREAAGIQTGDLDAAARDRDADAGEVAR